MQEEMLSTVIKGTGHDGPCFGKVTRERFTGDVLRHRPEGAAELSGRMMGESTEVLTTNL